MIQKITIAYLILNCLLLEHSRLKERGITHQVGPVATVFITFYIGLLAIPLWIYYFLKSKIIDNFK